QKTGYEIETCLEFRRVLFRSRRPGERPPHSSLVRLQLRERRPRHRRKRDVVVRQVDDGAVETVRNRRAGWTPCRVIGPEHEVVRSEERRVGKERRCVAGTWPE